MDDDLETLSANFLNWAKSKFNCDDAQAGQIIARTREIFDHGSRAIPSSLAQHSAPFAFCLAYQRQNRRSGGISGSGGTDQLIVNLNQIVLSLGVMLPSHKTDCVAIAQLPTMASFLESQNFNQKFQSSFLSLCTIQLDRCFELLDIYPTRREEIFPVSADIVSLLSSVLSGLRTMHFTAALSP
jgi:hypothetical protein